MSSLPTMHPASLLQEDDSRLLASLSIYVTAIGLVVDCAKCGSAVPLSVCQSDHNGNKGKPMARHFNCDFFRWFPKLCDSPCILAAIPLSPRSPNPSTLSSSHSAAPVKSTKGRPRKQGKPCVGPFCKRRGALKCARVMCLKHCQEVVLGSCLFHSNGGHDADEDNYETPLDPPPPFVEQQAHGLPSDAEESGLHNLHVALEVALTQRGIALPTSNEHLFPSLHDVLHGPLTSQAHTSIAIPTQLSQAPSASQSLPSPTTAALLSSSSLSQAPSQSLPLVPPVMVTLPPPLPLPAHCGPTGRQPRITQQLDKLWMSDLATRAQNEVEAQKVAARRQEMEKQSRQRFCLHWFDQDNVPAQSQWISNCLYYPQYRLTDDPDLLASLNMDRIEIFDMDSQRWIGAPLNFDFTLKSDCHLFLRRLGVVQCHDLDVLLAQLKQQSRPGHLRHNMKGKQDAVRTKLKGKHTIFSEESDSDIEFISVRKRPREESIEISDRTPTRVRIDPHILSLSPLPTCFSPPPISSQLSSLSSPKGGSSALLTPVASSLSGNDFLSLPPSVSEAPLTITQVEVPAYDPNGHEVWPAGMYTVDMAAGFRQMKEKHLRGRYLQPTLFRHVFGVPFIKGTYQDNLCAWQNTNPDILAQFERAGRTPEGLWAHYLAAQRVALGERSKRSSGPSKLREKGGSR
ncbi:hypothetical protein JVT61DRAFT_2649 [Boletus reticuloceps]|uniref:Uncharacterized protein n=1 Tax=Boletus reticuloceps TaxID=495285 RepID=A0A8I3A8I9_9AGAM|nr:hypothetical protein JVT61DRAFT_2649 [Boletus reticuloceps]